MAIAPRKGKDREGETGRGQGIGESGKRRGQEMVARWEGEREIEVVVGGRGEEDEEADERKKRRTARHGVAEAELAS